MNTELVKISFKIKVLFGLPVPGGSGGLRTSIREDFHPLWCGDIPVGQGEGVGRKD